MTCPTSKGGLRITPSALSGRVLSGGGPRGPDPRGDRGPEEAGCQADVWGAGAPLPGLGLPTQAGERTTPTAGWIGRQNRLDTNLSRKQLHYGI
jgi:hypothetical protein